MTRIGRTLIVLLSLHAGLPGSSFAARPFRLTTTFDIGGGGCVGETRIYEASTIAAERKAHAARGPTPWKTLAGALQSSRRYFLTTVGCAADRVAISLDGKAYLLDASRVEAIGVPVTYFSDDVPSLRVRIEKLSTAHAIEFAESDCTQRFEQVRVRIEFEQSTRVVLGTAINACP